MLYNGLSETASAVYSVLKFLPYETKVFTISS